MKKILLLLLLIFSFTTFAGEELSVNQNIDAENEEKLEEPDPVAMDLNVDLVGKRFRVKNKNIPMTLDYDQMSAFLKDVNNGVPSELLDLRIHIWQKENIGGILLRGTPVEVVEDLREEENEIVKVKVVGEEQDFEFYLWAYSLNKMDEK